MILTKPDAVQHHWFSQTWHQLMAGIFVFCLFFQGLVLSLIPEAPDHTGLKSVPYKPMLFSRYHAMLPSQVNELEQVKRILQEHEWKLKQELKLAQEQKLEQKLEQKQDRVQEKIVSRGGSVQDNVYRAGDLQGEQGPFELGEGMVVTATAYTYTGNNCATGVPPRRGLIAVDPRVIPLGAKLYVEGYGVAIAADTGGAIKGRKIDLFMESRKEAINWGRRKVVVYYLDK